MVKSLSLNDGRQILVSVIEILKVPHIDVFEGKLEKAQKSTAQVFTRIISDANQLFPKGSIAIEIMMLSEPVENQKYPGRIRLFFLVRGLTSVNAVCIDKIERYTDSIVTGLRSCSYDAECIDAEEYERILETTDGSNIWALVKSEKYEYGMQLGIPYYYADIFQKGGIGNFEGILETLCYEPGSAVSLQLISTELQLNEAGSIEMMYQLLQQAVNGMSVPGLGFTRDSMAEKPFRTYQYLQEKSRNTLLNYNILVFGNTAGYQNIVSRVSTLLSEEVSTERVAMQSIDISQERVNLPFDWIYYPWNLNQKLVYYYRNQQLWRVLQNYANLFRIPYLIDAEEAMCFFKLPVDNNQTPGISSNHKVQSSQNLSETVTDPDNIIFGHLEDSKASIGASPLSFSKHMLMVGMPGTGKTTFAFYLLLQFYKKGIPFLAIEPTKKEYRALLDAVPELQIFTPGNNQISPFVINPFIPPTGIAVEQYIPYLVSAFEAAIPMPSPLDTVFQQVINDCYALYGWKSYSKTTDPGTMPFGFHEFIIQFKRRIKKSDYSREVKGNLESGGVNRLSGLIEQNPYIYDTVNTVPLEDILNRPTIIELNAIGNSMQKALLMSIILTQVCAYTKQNMESGHKLNNIMMIDEAHVLFDVKNANDVSGKSNSETLQDMMAEVRSFGTGIIVADQTASAVGSRTVANTDIKVAFRLVETNEKDIIANSMGLSPVMQQRMSMLQAGEAYVNYYKLSQPVVIVSPDIRESAHIRLEVSNEEVRDKNKYWNTERKRNLKPFRECGVCRSKTCDFRVRADATHYARLIMEKRAASILDEESLIHHLINLPALIKTALEAYPQEKREMLILCTKIALMRKVQMEKGVNISKEKEIAILMGGKTYGL